MWGLGKFSVGKALAAHAWGPDHAWWILSNDVKSQGWWYVPAIPVLGRQRWEDPGASWSASLAQAMTSPRLMKDPAWKVTWQSNQGRCLKSTSHLHTCGQIEARRETAQGQAWLLNKFEASLGDTRPYCISLQKSSCLPSLFLLPSLSSFPLSSSPTSHSFSDLLRRLLETDPMTLDLLASSSPSHVYSCLL